MRTLIVTLNRLLLPTLLLALAPPLNVRAGPSAQSDGFADVARPFQQAFCIKCHSGQDAEAGIDLDAYRSSLDVSENRDVWQSVLEMVQQHDMPPEEEEQPSDAQRQRFVQWLEQRLAQSACTDEQPRPGRVTIRRLNRAEYNNTVRDLLGIEFRPADDFPSDDVGEGFDNIAEVLSLSPILVEKYLSAADQIIERTFQDPAAAGRIVICRPSDELSEEDCARRILGAFVSRAFRRPATDEEVTRLVQLAAAATESGASNADALKVTLKAVLCSPHFLFRIEDDPEADAVRELNGFELATRLSYFLWSSMPDERLFELGGSNQLQNRDVRDEEIRRMLLDPKASALVENFAGQWLQLKDLASRAPDPELFAAFDDPLRQAMQRETEMFFEHVVHQDRNILEFLDAPYTFVNERLATHYGIDGVKGDQFRKVDAPPQRRGILSHASVLLITSNPTRTSPVKRGKWILENILDDPPRPPPPGVEELDDQGQLLGSLRERMEQHRSNPTCASCHKLMDALGFGLENFDAIGAWRSRDGEFQIDASGTLSSGDAFQGPVDLARILREKQKENFCRCLVRKMLTYGLGRGLESYDQCAVDRIVEELEQNEYRFSSLVSAIAASDPFRLRGTTGE